MSAADGERQCLVYEVDCEDGRRCIVYKALEIRNLFDHVPDKWYVRPWPVMLPPGESILGPYDTAEQAERAVRVRQRAAGESVERSTDRAQP